MKANPIYKDVPGAPFKIGDRVVVSGFDDETAETKYANEIGQVVYFEYECGCGQHYPDDPMIGIQFGNAEIEEFWKTELTKCPYHVFDDKEDWWVDTWQDAIEISESLENGPVRIYVDDPREGFENNELFVYGREDE